MTLSTQLLLTATLMGGLLGAEPMETQTEAALTVWLYDYADVAPGTLERTRRQATRILNQAGLRVRWELCPTSAEEAEQNRDCARRAAVDTIRLGILSKKMVKKTTQRGIEFGYAVALAEGFGVVAGVYLDRTVREADSIGLERHIMLGHTIAHEIGHLLLGQGSHSKRGIMSPTWRGREVNLAKTGRFLFSQDQAERMQVQVAARIRAARADSVTAAN